MAGYLLSSHVHMCVAEGYLVLLDLRRDKYLAFGKTELRAIDLLLPGLQLLAEKSAATDDSVETLAQKLLSDGLITADCHRGRDASLTTVRAVNETCVHTEQVLDPAPPAIRARDVIIFAWSFLTARLLLRYRSIEALVNRVGSRNERLRPMSCVDQRIIDLVRKLHFMRPFLFARKDQCLLDALVHIEYLARHRIPASWVFGVTVEPFGAHCWAQIGNTVLNDSVETVGSFTPIMSV